MSDAAASYPVPPNDPMPREVGVLDLFEVREPSGSLLLVTSDAVAARDAAETGDTIVRRPWLQAPLGAALFVVKRPA